MLLFFAVPIGLFFLLVWICDSFEYGGKFRKKMAALIFLHLWLPFLAMIVATACIMLFGHGSGKGQVGSFLIFTECLFLFLVFVSGVLDSIEF